MFSVNLDDFRKWQRNLRDLTQGLPDVVEDIEEKAAELTADVARPLVRRRTGAAQGSVKALDYSGAWNVIGGDTNVRHFKWLNYAYPTRVHEGRYLWPAFEKSEQDVEDLMDEELLRALKNAGLA